MSEFSKKDQKLLSILLPGIFIFVGLVLVGITFAVKHFSENKKERCTQKATATVIRLERIQRTDSDHNTSITYAPVFNYVAEGKNITVQSNTSSNPCDYYEGQEVELFYNPQKLNEYYIPDDSGGKIFLLIFGFLGGLFVFMGIIIAIVLRKSFKKKSGENDFIEEQTKMETRYNNQSYYK